MAMARARVQRSKRIYAQLRIIWLDWAPLLFPRRAVILSHRCGARKHLICWAPPDHTADAATRRFSQGPSLPMPCPDQQ